MSENGLFFYFYFFYPTLKKQNEKDLEIRFNVIFSRHILHTQTLAVNKTFPRSRPSWHTYCAFNITFNKRSIAEKKTKKQHFLGLISFSAHIFFFYLFVTVFTLFLFSNRAHVFQLESDFQLFFFAMAIICQCELCLIKLCDCGVSLLLAIPCSSSFPHSSPITSPKTLPL